MIEFLQDNTNKLIFTGIVAIIIGVISKLLNDKKGGKETSSNQKNVMKNNFTPTLNFYQDSEGTKKPSQTSITNEIDSLEKRKLLTRILFIDDDTKFKVVNILKTAGWVNTRLITDVENVDDPIIRDVDIFFVDIQGVGIALQCQDEGLGLALILRRKYPNKKIVIYSAEIKGDRFHQGLRKADGFLAKNAEPYEFQELVEQYSQEIHPNA